MARRYHHAAARAGLAPPRPAQAPGRPSRSRPPAPPARDSRAGPTRRSDRRDATPPNGHLRATTRRRAPSARVPLAGCRPDATGRMPEAGRRSLAGRTQHTNDPEDSMATDLDLLRDLCAAPAPTGFEAPVLDLVRQRLAALSAPDGDPLGNVWGTVKGQGAPHVVVTAHADQIGLIVTYVDEQGLRLVRQDRRRRPAAPPRPQPHRPRRQGRRARRRRPQALPQDEQGRARQGPRPQRPVARHRLLHARAGARAGPDRRPHHVPAELPPAGRRPLRLAGLRQPRRRLRLPARPGALRRRRRPPPTSRRCSRCTRRPRSWAPRPWPSSGSPT